MNKEDELAMKIDTVVNAVKLGTNLLSACHYAGLSAPTVYSWMERGRIEEDRLDANPKARPKASEVGCLQIWQDIRMANAEATLAMENAVFAAAKEGEWKAASWYLERRMPEIYGKSANERQPQSLSGNSSPAEIEG